MLVASKSCRACGRGFSGAEVFCPHDGSRLLGDLSPVASGFDPLLGTVLDGRYRVLRVVGEGGMGLVYEAEHLLIERRVALKVLREDFSKKPEVVERFRREAKSASRIGHPNIVDVLDFGETPSGASYCVMEMLQGQDLADQIARAGALAPERAAAIAYQCCHALGIAHDKGIVHRDLKPENIFLIERDGYGDFVKIVDFGVAKISDPEVEPGAGGRAKLTRTGVIFGTPEYMSPEQATGLVPDHRVDIYAMGITLYELLTGRVPFEGESFMAVLSKHATKQVPALRDMHPRLQVSPALENVVFQALRKERAERFQHMRDMAAALAATPEMPALPFRLSGPYVTRGSLPSPTPIAVDIPTNASPPPAPPDPLPEPVRRPGLGRLLAAGAASVAIAIAVLVWTRSAAPDTGVAAATEPAQPSVAITPTPAAAAAPEPEAVAAKLAEVVTTKPARVTIRVTTEPAGARILLESGDELCAQTPCSFETARDALVALQARLGPRRATTTLTPSADADLHLVLRAPQKARQAKLRAEAAAFESAPDLKVPDVYR